MGLLDGLRGRGAAASFDWVETDALPALLDSASPPVLIDVREPAEFSGPLGHIETARNIPLNDVAARTADLLAERRPLVLVCHTDKRSAAAAEQLVRAGATKVAVLRGGMVGWRSRRAD
ncbi:rhodanese-like domain-containing protein [Rhodopila sp.]|uniref:rhodanese-like domain-containing protein n=1 Tax=Rhodopila sp. TaxID=2480087 RepID=UPI003D0F4CC5